MPTETTTFLAAEQAVQDLLANLQRLKTEIEGYARAKTTLDESGKQVAGLASELSQLAEQSRNVIASLAKIGTPEILKQIDGLTTANRDLLGGVNKVNEDVRQGQARLEWASQKSSEAITAANRDLLGGLNKLNEDVHQGQARLESASHKTSEAVTVALDKMSGAVGSLKDSVTNVQSTVDQRLRRVSTTIWLGLFVATAVIVAAILFGGRRDERDSDRPALPSPQAASQPVQALP